jgi:hypothetical protein
MFRPYNPYASRFHALQKEIMEAMSSRTIRAWHYTRLTTEEVNILRKDGVHVSTPKSLKSRFDSLVASGVLSAQIVKALYAGSPFHSDQLEGRSGKLWMTSHPIEIQDSGVERLMKFWGGEVASFWTKDAALLAVLAALGKPRVIELAIPLAFTQHCYAAGKAVLATFGRVLGCIPSSHSFDLYVTTPLGPDSVLRVHSEGDWSFHSMAFGYPEGYVDMDIERR